MGIWPSPVSFEGTGSEGVADCFFVATAFKVGSTMATQKALFNSGAFEQKVGELATSLLKDFKRITRFYALFHFGIACLLCAEIVALLGFFPFLAKTVWLAILLAAFFLTGFIYFVLRFYFQTKKPEQFIELKEFFFSSCKQLLPFGKGEAEYHLSLTHAAYRFASQLDRQEGNYYSLPFFSSLASFLGKLSAWAHWKDVHKMKEILLLAAVAEHVELVKKEPCDLEAHAALANAYLALSKLYYSSPDMRERFKNVALRAIEEFKILDHFAPQDPWVHAQLATIYRDLGMTLEEIAAYEHITTFSPKESEVLLRLGILYFQEGYNAKALAVYEKLKHTDSAKAEELIDFYGADHEDLYLSSKK